ncbi:MAG TPA: thioredoxin family protein [Flavitalea sp.]|nr:thioredoxin family protein [Flavitalea sp.]HTF31536.1 thioredoxin family protein [Flavitalea sp.]
MKLSKFTSTILLGLSVLLLSFTVWQPDFDTAQKLAHERNQLILLNFSGSDWCGPCIRMKKEIFSNEAFSKMADTTLVMVNADFPRNKKNQLNKELRTQNEQLADKYNPEGKFPYTVLLSANGTVIRSWEGMPDETAVEFALSIKKICDGY